MKYNMNNNNDMMTMMQEMMKAMFMQGMAQGAQMKQAQAMGAGDAGKALPLQGIEQAQAHGRHARQAQGKGKAQAQAQGKGIEYTACLRKNEKELIGKVRDALVKGDKAQALSCIKAWHVMVNKDKNVKDETIIALYDNLCKVAFEGKYATVKGTKDACIICKSCGRIKAWLYTWNRGNVTVMG